MRRLWIAAIAITACTSEANHLGNPLLLPISGLGTAAENAVYNQRRGRVEIIVKSNHPGIVDEIRKGGGPNLLEAMDVAGIPSDERAARIIQMQGDTTLYQTNPGALVVALMVYGQP
ncbi:hypothetical protein [Yoonia sp. 2307UL14-13]|uniref:hypothetical protein n=1 Tax=Yoonia sp. 2307UL14-13 TaxID=3126506 RepID=UPI0030A8A707